MAHKPNIRFGDFTEKWKEAQLGQLVKEHRVSNQLVHHQNLLSLSYGKIVRRDIRANKGLLPASFDTYQIIDKDTIVFRVTDLQNDKKSLRVAISEEEGIISPAYVCVDTNSDEISASFLHQILHYHDVITKLYYKMGDGLRQTLNYGDLKCIKILYPKPNEQKAIAEVFRLLNSTITQREKELEKLKNIKRALLEKLFPQNGSKVPALRFKEFTEEWGETCIGNAFQERDERSANGELLSVTINSGIRRAKEMERTFVTGDLSHYKVVRVGDIAYNTMRMWQGACGVSDYTGIVSPAYTIATPQKGHCSAFYACLFKTNNLLHEFRINSQGLTSDTWNLKYHNFSNIKITVPIEREQQKIANIFLAVNNLLSLREKQLTLLKHTKQALLEQMFVNE